MKSVVFGALLGCLFAASCKKTETRVCRDPVQKMPCYAAAYGFTAAEIDTVVVKRYQHGGNFTQLNGTDTTFCSGYAFRGDTLIDRTGTNGRSFYSLGSLSDAADYEILIPGAGMQYFISYVSYAGDSITTYVTTGDCGGRSLPVAPDSVVVNNQPLRTLAGYKNESYLFLHK